MPNCFCMPFYLSHQVFWRTMSHIWCIPNLSQPPPFIPPVVPPVPLVQLPTPPAQPLVPPTHPIQSVPMPQLNWFLFQPEFWSKPDEDEEAHLLRTSNWMDTHAFLEGIRVQRFYLTLIDEARLWYDLHRPIALDWNGIQNQFR